MRSLCERIWQTLVFDLIGLAISVPIYVGLSGHSPWHGTGVLLALVVTEFLWSILHNIAFDRMEWRRFGRVASCRPQRWRVIHACCLEASSTAVTVPLLVWVGGHGWGEAVLLDLGLMLVYAGWTYVFHLVWDWWRPVGVVPVGLPMPMARLG